ncbi:hypothetical protein OMR07_01865, partial [Methylobacterium organophilum]|nr:hypothetical protein [Methylobacterium organophilum]
MAGREVTIRRIERSQGVAWQPATGTIITNQFKEPDYDAIYVFRNSAYDVLQAGLMVDEALAQG